MHILLLVFVLVFFYLLLARHSELEKAAKDSLVFVGSALIPALFPFAVLSRFVLSAGLIPCQNKLSQKTARLLHIAPGLLPAYLLGLFCGFPIGAYAASSLYEAGLCQEKDAHRSACLSNNASAAFLFGTAALFPHPHAAIILLASQTAATLFISFFSTNHTERSLRLPKETPSYLSLAADAVSKAGAAMLSLSAFVTFFSVFSKALLLAGCPTWITLFLEPTSAVRYAASLANTLGAPLSLSLASFSLSWSGLSVIMQTQALFGGKLPLKKHILTRFAIALLAFGTALFSASLF